MFKKIGTVALFFGFLGLATFEVQAQMSGPTSCIAHIRRTILQSEAVRLCQGAVNGAPGECFTQFYGKTDLSAALVVSLCKGAKSVDPILCYDQVYSHPETKRLGRGMAVLLCAKATSLSPVNCAIDTAQRLRLPNAQMLALCKENQYDVEESLVGSIFGSPGIYRW